MMATPNSDTKPTAAEMLKLVPVRYSAQMPPTATSKTLLKTTIASRNEWNADVEQDEDQAQRQRDDDHQVGRSASSICSNSPLQTAR